MVCTHMQVFIRIWGALDGGASQMVLKPRHLVGLGQGQGWDLVGFSFSPCYFFFPTSEAFYLYVLHPQASLVAQMVNHLPTMQETGV